jgi:hypothetical protein
MAEYNRQGMGRQCQHARLPHRRQFKPNVCGVFRKYPDHIAVTNTGPTAAVIQSLTFQLLTGTEDSALSYNEYTFASASTSGTAGTATMQTTNNSVTMTIRNVASDTSAKNNAMNTTLTFAGPLVQDKVSLEYHNNITFAAYDTITVQLSGKIWSAAGQQASIVISLGWNDDSWNNILFLQRSSAP